MTRATKQSRIESGSNEESKDNRNEERTNATGYEGGSEEVRPDDSTLHRTLDRVHPREAVVYDCTICGERDIEKSAFAKHIAKNHPRKNAGIPVGYYGCKSGAGFFGREFTKGPCKWLCSFCGKEKWFFGKDNTHGGPDQRLLDRRYGLAYCESARYPDHKRYLGKVDGASGPVVFYHDGAPNPPQPYQEDPKVLALIEKGKPRAKSVQGRAKPEGGGKRSSPRPKRLSATG